MVLLYLNSFLSHLESGTGWRRSQTQPFMESKIRRFLFQSLSFQSHSANTSSQATGETPPRDDVKFDTWQFCRYGTIQMQQGLALAPSDTFGSVSPARLNWVGTSTGSFFVQDYGNVSQSRSRSRQCSRRFSQRLLGNGQLFSISDAFRSRLRLI